MVPESGDRLCTKNVFICYSAGEPTKNITMRKSSVNLATYFWNQETKLQRRIIHGLIYVI